MILQLRLGFMLSEKSELQPMRRIIFLGFSGRPGGKEGVPNPGKDSELDTCNQGSSGKIAYLNKATDEADWTHQCGLKSNSFQQTTSQEMSVTNAQIVGQVLEQHRFKHPNYDRDERGIFTVAEQRLAESRPSSQAPYCFQNNIHRQLNLRAGGYLEDPHQDTSGTWSPEEKSLHINCLEMRAVANTIKAFAEELRNEVVIIATDNSTVVNYINKEGGTRSFSLEEEPIKLFEITMALNVHLRARHIAGSLNLVAGTLSREGKGLPTEWSLNESVFRALSKEYGLPEVDLFATRLNRKIDVYFSPVPDSLAIGADALVHDWSNKHSYAFPPFALIPKVLEKVRKSVNCRNNANCSARASPSLVHESSQPASRLAYTPRRLVRSPPAGSTSPPSTKESKFTRLEDIERGLEKRGFSKESARAIARSSDDLPLNCSMENGKCS